jgi:hypothetical protein
LSGDRFAGQVHDGVRAVDRRGPRAAVAVRRPRHRARACRDRGHSPGEDDDVVAVADERFGERTAEKPGAAGNHDVHALFNPANASKIPGPI